MPISVVWQARLLSVLRIVVALLFIQHGSVKLFGFPAPGPAQLSTLLLVAALIEFVGGLLVLVGLFTRVAAFIMSGEMAVAYFEAHAPKSFFPYVSGGDLAVLFCFVFLYLAFAGGGPWSLDAVRRPGLAV